MGHLLGDDKAGDLAKGAQLKLALWLALVLAKKNMVRISLPNRYGPSVRADLEAGPTVANCLVDLRQRAGGLSGSEAVKATTCGASSSTMLMLLLYRCLWPAAARNANAAAPGA